MINAKWTPCLFNSYFRSEKTHEVRQGWENLWAMKEYDKINLLYKIFKQFKENG